MSAVNDSEKERLKNDDEETEQQQQQTMPPNEADPPTASSAAAKMDPEAEPLNAPAASAGDDSKVKFIGGNDNVDIEKGKKKDEEFSSPALTKAELMKFAYEFETVISCGTIFSGGILFRLFIAEITCPCSAQTEHT